MRPKDSPGEGGGEGGRGEARTGCEALMKLAVEILGGGGGVGWGVGGEVR